jgi:hypothetical protein
MVLTMVCKGVRRVCTRRLGIGLMSRRKRAQRFFSGTDLARDQFCIKAAE